MKSKKLTVKNKPEELELIREFIEEAGQEWKMDAGLVFKVNLVLEEYINNLINYGFSDQLPHEISLELLKETSGITLLIKDDGNPFDITEFPENEDLDKPLEERKIGGLGIHLIKNLAEKAVYASEDGVNTLTLLIRPGD